MERGLAGAHVGLVGPNEPDWALWAFGIWIAGGVLVPLQHPLGVRDKGAVAGQLRALFDRAHCEVVVAHDRHADVFPADSVIPWGTALPGESSKLDPASVAGDDLAVIQFTSGSTGAQKCVMLEHDRVVQSVHNISRGLGVTSADRFMGWAPLYHDLGLFGYLVRPLIAGCEGHILPTERFARDPSEWFRVMTRAGATVTTAPSSGYAVALKRARSDSDGIDLSSLRSAIFGAEMTVPEVVDRLRTEGARYGLDPNAPAGSYGMAEATLTISVQPGGMRMEEKEIDQLAGGSGAGGLGRTRRICTCGPPVPGVDVRIVSSDGRVVEDGVVGEIEIRSYGLMRGYMGVDPKMTFREDGWFPTGDLGYLSAGEVFVTGRLKDVLISMGATYAPEDLEWAAERVRRVRKGRSVAFSGAESDGEVVLALEPRDESDTDGLASEVSRSISSSLGLAPKDVLVLSKGAIPKTTSGKLRRSAVRDLYARGELAPVNRSG